MMIPVGMSRQKTKVWKVKVNEKGMEFPDKMELQRHWKEGDELYWIDYGNGNWYIVKNYGEEDNEIQSD